MNFHKTYEFDGIHIVWSGSGDCAIRFPIISNVESTLQMLQKNIEAWPALEELWQDGLLKDNGSNEWIIYWDALERFGSDEDSPLDIIGIPRSTPLAIHVLSHGSVVDKNFRAFVEIRHPTKGALHDGDFPCPGPAIIFNKSSILPLSSPVRLLMEAVRGRDVDWTDLESRMAYLARVKLAAHKAGARLDSYLKNEDYEIADAASIDIREDSPEEITLIPRVPNIDEFDPSGGEILTSERPPTVLSKPGPGLRRKRLIIDRKLRHAISQLPKRGKVRGTDVPSLLTNPEQIVPEGFDLSLFSERVKGIKTRVYNSRPYIHIKRSQSGGWFEGVPGVAVEDWSPSEQQEDSDDSNMSGLSPETYRELTQKAKETGSEYVRWNDGWIRIDQSTSERFEDALNNFTPQDGVFRLPAGSILDIYENLSILEFVDKQALKVLEGDLIPEDLPDEPPPKNLGGQLYPYQIQGYRWLSRLDKYQMGGLLADDMGLGKTIQVIAHILQLKNIGSNGPHLIVVPKTLLENWSREIRKFSNNVLSVILYDAGQRWPGTGGFENVNIVLTTYETLRRDQARLATIDWNMVVCDEAQYAKNPTAQRTCAVKALKSKHRAALTGTPVENGLIEFWCIMDFVQPGLLGSWTDFRSKYERPIIDSDNNEDRKLIIRKLLEEVRGHYLRRLKNDILKDLPPKVINHHRVPIDDKQLQLYRAIARQGRLGGKGAALSAIQKLLILCANPWAASCAGDNDQSEFAFPKLNETLTILERIHHLEEKAIVFTDFKAVQRMLQSAIRNKFGLWPDIINGELNTNRQAVIDIFSKKPGFNVIILGHQVAGVGLNITAANHVIHYTRPWNPAKEIQATDRTHRIGQSKPVHVYYPIITDERFKTVEERLDELIRSKEDLARDVLRPSSERNVQIEDLLECLDDAEAFSHH